MNNRVKKLRKSYLHLTQQQFADRLKISRSNIASYEVGKNNFSDAVISLICREFNVNEKWLRNGEGDVFIDKNAFSLDEIALQCNATELELEIVRTYFQLDPNIRGKLIGHFAENIGKKFFNPEKRDSFSPASSINNIDTIPDTATEFEEKYPPVKDELKRNAG